MADIPAGWPCADLPSSPPSVADQEAQPTADSLLPQILPLCPRGSAWGTDETGDGKGAAPVQRRVWRAIAGWAASHLGLDWTAATQTFPSALTYTLADWERDLGLPDPCARSGTTFEARVRAVRARYQATGGSSIAYLVCLARAAGYEITIEEPGGFEFGASGFGTAGFGAPGDLARFIVHLGSSHQTWITFGALGFGEEGFGSTDAADVLCVLERARPAHTQAIYDLAGQL